MCLWSCGGLRKVGVFAFLVREETSPPNRPVSGSLHPDRDGLIPLLATDRPVATCLVACCVSCDSCVGVATGVVPSWRV